MKWSKAFTYNRQLGQRATSNIMTKVIWYNSIYYSDWEDILTHNHYEYQNIKLMRNIQLVLEAVSDYIAHDVLPVLTSSVYYQQTFLHHTKMHIKMSAMCSFKCSPVLITESINFMFTIPQYLCNANKWSSFNNINIYFIYLFLNNSDITCLRPMWHLTTLDTVWVIERILCSIWQEQVP